MEETQLFTFFLGGGSSFICPYHQKVVGFFFSVNQIHLVKERASRTSTLHGATVFGAFRGMAPRYWKSLATDRFDRRPVKQYSFDSLWSHAVMGPETLLELAIGSRRAL